MKTHSKMLSRLWKHLTATSATGRRAFPPATLKAIEQAIADGETRHRAEVRMIVEPALGLQAVLQHMSARERARELFAHYRVWDTEENCGVLVYVNLADHKVEIVADRGAGRAISNAEWQAVCHTMTHGFARGAFHDSVLAALDQLNRLLQERYPGDGSRANELADRPVVL
ncbi:TPM domain-containing protein [Noviherbaspirillum sp. UKPF54]|uniref:TPM domain-containing protein n=1 Tax=Noviherbaspirillum sp. UKPF54 TaxID=2601898 RepID=UPI0011B16CB4|nr:TPM domain-containing protein [Noviherbaspirillum sp. UKPF54]QDZ28686.1 TPM domain-containing protein [Noviherbaspirillum sp. UKPF54]